jgi:hypothetical protein
LVRELELVPGMVVWEAERGSREIPVRVVVERCDLLRGRGG